MLLAQCWVPPRALQSCHTTKAASEGCTCLMIVFEGKDRDNAGRQRLPEGRIERETVHVLVRQSKGRKIKTKGREGG